MTKIFHFEALTILAPAFSEDARHFWGATRPRVRAAAPRCRDLLAMRTQSCFGEGAETSTRGACAPRNPPFLRCHGGNYAGAISRLRGTGMGTIVVLNYARSFRSREMRFGSVLRSHPRPLQRNS